jgi:pilus assembly protein CpaB
LLRRTKTIVFNDDPDIDDTDAPASSARRDLGGRPSLRKGPVLMPREAETFLPQRESVPEEQAPNAVHERQNFLRSEFENEPITRGSQETLAALRADFRRKHVALDDDEGGAGLSLPSFSLSGKAPRILLVVVALLAGGLAAFLALGRQPEPAPAPVIEQAAPAPEAPTLEVLVARAPIQVGTRLTSDLLEWQKWPEATVRTEYVTSAATPDGLTQFIGAVARTELLAGEPIRPEKLGQAGAGYLSAILEPGKRAVAVPINPRSASGGFVQPNDHVDVVLTVGQDSRTILEDVRVLAINARLGASGTEAATANPEEGMVTGDALATLELDPSQAELLISASNGQLSLVLRPTADSKAPSDAARSAVNQNIRLTSPFWLQTPQPGSGGAAPVYQNMQ